MPYKCSVKFCRSNYDSTSERVSLFQFPPDPQQRQQWLDNLELTTNVTNFSRVCVKHFRPEDVDDSSRKKMLKFNAVPIGIFTFESSTKEQDVETGVESCHVEDLETPVDTVSSFTQFLEGVEEMQASIIENWNIYIHHEGVCFYRLSSDENFTDIYVTSKLLVNKHMNVKVYCNDQESSHVEFEPLLKDCHLETWSEFKNLLRIYQDDPQIVAKNDPVKSLKKAFEALQEVFRDELQEKVDMLKDEVESLINLAETLEGEEDFYQPNEKPEQVEMVEEEFVDECYEIDDSEPQVESKTVEAPINLKCDNCSITLMTAQGFRSHKKSCQTKKLNIISLNTCDSCCKPFRSINALRNHMLSHNESLHEKCPLCQDMMASSDLKRHINVVHKRMQSYVCNYCDASFTSMSLRKEHEKSHKQIVDLQVCQQVVEGITTYSCPKCAASFDTRSLLKRHMEKNCWLGDKRRVYRYSCPFHECSKNFQTKILAASHMLKKHQVSIQNIDKFCFECNKEFEDYVNHARIHSCNFSCSFCGAKFLTQEKASKHEESRHANETASDRPFKCSTEGCEVSFKTINHLKSHQQAIHMTQEREFACDHCSKKFASRALLTAHTRSHRKDFAMFPCNFDDCQRRFKKLNNLKEHNLKEHGCSEIYLCNFEDDCGSRFKMLHDLRLHRLKEHGVNFNIHKYFAG